MNIWSFPPWTCHRWAFEAARQRIVFVTLRDIQRREIKPQRGGGRTWNGKHRVLALFTCLEALFVSKVLTTNASGQRCRTIFTFLETIACFNVFSFPPPHSDSLSCECCCGLQKVENFPFKTFALLLWSCWVFVCRCCRSRRLWCVCVCTRADGSTGGLHSSNIWNFPTWDQMGERYMGSRYFPINTSPASTGR